MEISTSDDLLKCIAQAMQQERLAIATEAAKEDISQRLDTGAVAGFIEQFLLSHWLPVLTRAHASGKEEEITRCRQELDDLIWSTTPKANAQQRRELIAKLPSILASLNRDLDEIGWHGNARQSFFTKLAERQATYARAPISARRKIEYAVTVAQKASERLMNRQVKPNLPPDEVNRVVDAMRQGQWLDFQFTPYSNEPMRRYKLAWISPGMTMYIFVHQSGEDFFSLHRKDLCQALRDKEAVCVWLHDLADHDEYDTFFYPEDGEPGDAEDEN